jgi:hypothetical protein
MNVAYKHLDSKLRISELTIGQWIGVFAAVMGAILYGRFISPFGPAVTFASAVYLAGLPIVAIVAANSSDFDLWLLVRSAIRWHRIDARYLPGSGSGSTGYRLTEPLEEAQRAERERVTYLDLASLWGEQ